MTKKHEAYQDYVIRDGKLIGDFEDMYQDFEDPWEQSTREEWASEKAIAIHNLTKLKCNKVLELGCGLGLYSNQIQKAGFEVLGIDISKTAIAKAEEKYPNCRFKVGKAIDFDIYEDFQPDAIIFAEITWYILDELDALIKYLKTKQKTVYIIHLLTTYPKGIQQYGKEKFTNLDEIKQYFDIQYIEWGEISCSHMEGCIRTYFVGKI